MLANYAHTKLIVNKINTPLTLNKEAIKPETDPDNPTDPNNPGDGDIYDRFNLHYHTCPTDADNYLCRKIINESNGKEYTKDYLTSLPRDYLKDFGVGKAVFNKDSEYSPYIYYGSPYSIFQHYKKVSGYNFKNYVWFAGRKWKILRINTDGSIRIMLDSFNAENPDYQQDLYNLYNLNVPYQNSGVAAEDGYKYIVSDDKCTKENPCKSIIYYNNGDEYYSTYSNYNSKNYSQIKDYLETWCDF